MEPVVEILPLLAIDGAQLQAVQRAVNLNWGEVRPRRNRADVRRRRWISLRRGAKRVPQRDKARSKTRDELARIS